MAASKFKSHGTEPNFLVFFFPGGLLLPGKPMRFAVLVVIVALLSVTSAAIALQTFHGSDSGHHCDFCHLGHLPVVHPDSGVRYLPPIAVVAQVECDTASWEFSLFLTSQPPRAPPA